MRKLTEKQRQVLSKMAEGNSTKEAGGQLGLSDRTVQKYLTVIRSKMDVKNTMQAIYKGAKAGLI
jgi:DNA-binding NarL/FixJ family response regulator